MEKRVKPFVINLEKPFVIDREYVKRKEKQDREQKGELIPSNRIEEKEEASETMLKASSLKPLIRPFEIIPPEQVKIAHTMALDDKELERYLAGAINQYVAAGGNMKELLKVEPNTSKEVGTFNYELELKKRVFRFFEAVEGEIRELSYGIAVTIFQANGKRVPFYAEIESDKIKEASWLKRATHSLARLPKDKEEREMFENVIQQCIESEGDGEELIYQRAGWYNIPGKGWRYVFHDGIIGEWGVAVHTGTAHYKMEVQEDRLGNKEVFQIMMKAGEICRNVRTSKNLLLFAHAGVLTTLFNLAGHEINFSFMIVGPTNCRKTSLVTAIAKVFDRNRLKADAEFATATSAGIEQTLGRYRDATVIIDDYKAGANLTQQREMNRKLDEVLRFYGDRVEKKRMLAFTPKSEKMFFPIGGNCVITGEFAPEAIESSMTRIFLTEVNKDDVNNEKLRVFQEERWIVPTHFYDFLCWVTKRFDICTRYIVERYPSYRDEKRYIVGRFSDMYATFMVTADLLCMYAQELGFWNEEEQRGFSNTVRVGLEIELEIMEERFRKRDKATQVLLVLKKALEKQLITPTQLNQDSCSRAEDFYEDDQMYYISAQYLRKIIHDFGGEYSDTQRIINSEDMIAVLERKNALEIIEKDGRRIRSRKLPIQRGNARRYLYVKKEIIDQIDDE